jgi:predicted transcriptional regulator
MRAWQPRRLTTAQLEALRLAAMSFLRQGCLSQAGIARRLGVSEAAVSH